MKRFYFIAGLILVFGLLPGSARAEHAGHAAMKESGAPAHTMMVFVAASPTAQADVDFDCMGDHCPACFSEDVPLDHSGPMTMCGNCFMVGAPLTLGNLIAPVNPIVHAKSIPFFRYQRPPDPTESLDVGSPTAPNPILHSVLRL